MACFVLQYGYRLSKAAVNMAGVTLAGDLKKSPGAYVALVHPGVVSLTRHVSCFLSIFRSSSSKCILLLCNEWGSIGMCACLIYDQTAIF